MDARARVVRDILNSADQYLIPFFQRPYSWKLKNWQQLWDDMVPLIDEPRIEQHFMGPLVCLPVKGVPSEIQKFQLIDGQQRLTTLTVLLSVLRDLAVEAQETDLAEDITERYLTHKREKGLSRYKVVPRVGDREVLFAVVEGKTADHSRRDGIIRAQRYFKETVRKFLQDDAPGRLRKLVQTITSRLSLVMITVDGENPYEIFESLNSRGLPLEESDLIRNFVFMKVPLEEQEAFNADVWQPFESMFEATDDDDALNTTAFYRDYLMRDGVYSRKHSAFVDFKAQMNDREISAVELAHELRRYGKLWLMVHRPQTCGDIKVRAMLEDIHFHLDIGTSHPLLMHLLDRWVEGRLGTEELLGCLIDLQSFVIRRSVCGESTRGYNEMLPGAIRAIRTAPREDLRKYWTERGWPDDQVFVLQLQEFDLYRREKKKGELMLRRVETSFNHKEAPPLDDMTIEHVLPQSIEDGKRGKLWQAMLGDDWQSIHEKYLHRLGNLTLTGYNSPLSNKPFEKKKEWFATSNLQLNKGFAKLAKWGASQIEARSQELAERVGGLWPSAGEYRRGTSAPDTVVAVEDGAELKAMWPSYWSEFGKVLAGVDPELRPLKESGRALLFETGRYSCWFEARLDAEEACVCVRLCFRGRFAPIFLKMMRQDETAIEAELNRQVDWEDEHRIQAASLYLDSAQPADRADWNRQHVWLANTLSLLARVLGPRIAVPESAALDDKKLAHSFWNIFFKKATGEALIKWPEAKARTQRLVPLSRNIALRVQVEPEQHWMWVGLEITGSKAAQIANDLEKEAMEVRALADDIASREDEKESTYLGLYRFAMLTDRTRWPKYMDWMESAAQKYFHLASGYAATRKPGAKQDQPDDVIEGEVSSNEERHQYRVEGHSITSILRALGKNGFSFESAKAACDRRQIPVNESTIRIQLKAGSEGRRGDPAPLTDDQLRQWREAGKASIDVP